MKRILYLLVALFAGGCAGSPQDDAPAAGSTPPTENQLHCGHWVDNIEQSLPYTELILLDDGRGMLVANGEDDVMGVEFDVEETGQLGVVKCTPRQHFDGPAPFTLTAINGQLKLKGDDFDDIAFHQVTKAIPDSMIQEYFEN